MPYFISFLEGIITFISPCLLPMIPIYLTYFAGSGERTTKKTIIGALGFVTGFTIIFVSMGALAGTIGSFFTKHQDIVNIVCGLIVIFFGLNFMGVFKLTLFKGMKREIATDNMSFVSSVLFGIVFSLYHSE